MRFLRLMLRSPTVGRSCLFQRGSTLPTRIRSFSSQQRVSAVAEIGVALGFGLGCGIGMRYLTERDVQNWKPQRELDDAKQPVIRSRLTQEQKRDREIMSMFLAWLDKMRATSPLDPKDTVDFKFVTFTELPPFTAQHRSVLSSVMSPSLWDKFKAVRTASGYSFSNAIQTGVTTPHVGVGFTAGDEESYTAFEEVVYRLLIALHNFDPYTQAHTSDLDPSHLRIPPEDQDKLQQHVRGTRLEATRNLSGFALPCGTNREERRQVECTVQEILSTLPAHLCGRYLSLSELSPADAQRLSQLDMLMPRPHDASSIANAGGAREWSDGRGVLVNSDASMAAWVNGEDHCKLIITEPGAAIHKAFANLCLASQSLHEGAQRKRTAVMHHPQLGFLSTCPSRVGTALSASLTVNLPNLDKDPPALRQLAAQHRLAAFRPGEEPTWRLSNQRVIGVTEVEVLQGLVAGVVRLIDIEQTMAANPNMSAMDALKLLRSRKD